MVNVRMWPNGMNLQITLTDIAKLPYVCVHSCLYSYVVWAEAYVISGPPDPLAVCARRHGNLSLCVRLVLVNGEDEQESPSQAKSPRMSRGWCHGWKTVLVCPLKQLLCFHCPRNRLYLERFFQKTGDGKKKLPANRDAGSEKGNLKYRVSPPRFWISVK